LETSVLIEQLDRWANPNAEPIDSAIRLLEEMSTDHGDGPTEAFHRSSASMRFERDSAGGASRCRLGREEGGALRWFDPRDGTLGFAAASGDARHSFDQCRVIATRIRGKPVERCPWNTDAAPVEDLETAARVPEAEEILDWLRRNTPDSVDSAWVEIAVTTETWLNSGGNVQKRGRSRVWAAWTPRSEGAKPVFAAARTWGALSRADRAEAWRDRAPGAGHDFPWPDDARLVFSPETSAILAHMLVRTAHHPFVEPGTPVGPGWVLTADPTNHQAAIFGSSADDAGFSRTTRFLADGRHVIGSWGGPGTLRRGSFRDPPQPEPVNLSLEPPKIDPPRRAIWITSIDLHPAADGWTVRLQGRRYPDGAPLRPKWTRFHPQLLLKACLGGLGPARESHVGMTTPALVFEELASSAS